jgi:hypothetical protein
VRRVRRNRWHIGLTIVGGLWNGSASWSNETGLALAIVLATQRRHSGGYGGTLGTEADAHLTCLTIERSRTCVKGLQR